MAKKNDAPDALDMTDSAIALPSAPAAQAPATLAATTSADATQSPIPAAVSDVADDQTPIDPQEELRCIAKKLIRMAKPRTLRETLKLFTDIRNTKWAISTRNGIPVDISNPDRQWEKNKVLRGATWVEIATLKGQFALDVRGANNQLWWTQPPDVDEQGNVIKKYPARPVKGYNDDELPPPQKQGKHWLAELRPDLFSRHERLASSGGGVPLPNLPASSDELPKVISIYTLDLEMAERNLASRGVR